MLPISVLYQRFHTSIYMAPLFVKSVYHSRYTPLFIYQRRSDERTNNYIISVTVNNIAIPPPLQLPASQLLIFIVLFGPVSPIDSYLVLIDESILGYHAHIIILKRLGLLLV